MVTNSEMRIKSIHCLFIVLLVSLPTLSFGQAEESQPSFPAARIINTEERKIHSDIINQDFEIYISLPDGYQQSDTTYPVLYLTDANTYFGLMTDMARNLQWGGEMPETIIVGIGYPISDYKSDDEKWEKWLARRMRDLSPTNTAQSDQAFGIENVKSGGGPQFMQFLEKELFPFIENEYKAMSSERTYAGFSLGGLFGLYTLFEKPSMFRNYIIGSASIWYDNKLILNMEEQFAGSHNDLDVNLFMSAGELEEEVNAGMVRNMLELNSSLKSRQYKSLNSSAVILEGETHMSAPAVSFQRGLRILFRK